MPATLAALVAFVANTNGAGELDGGRECGYIWLACSCGAQIMHPRGERRRGHGFRGLPAVSPCAPGAAGAALQPRLEIRRPQAGRAGFTSREVPRCRSGDRATSSGARRGRGASQALECPFCDAAQLYSTSDVVTTRSELRRPKPGGRPPGPGRGPRRPPEQAGPARVLASGRTGCGKRCCALRTELHTWGILVPAPGTLHAETSQQAGPGHVGRVEVRGRLRGRLYAISFISVAAFSASRTTSAEEGPRG
jgi:hypothetical protein